jgi:CBS domain-containing protein
MGEQVRATEFMTTDVVTLHPRTPIKDAAGTLAAHGIASAPVVLADGRLVGIVSELDLLAHDVPPDPLTRLALVAPDPGPLPTVVQDVMTRDVVTLPPDADAAQFLQHMLRDRILCVPVVVGGRVVGVVSRRDLLRLLARPDAEIAAAVGAALARALPGERWQVRVVDGVAEIASMVPTGQPRVAVRVAQSVPGVLRVGVSGPPAAGPSGPDPPRPTGDTDPLSRCLDPPQPGTLGFGLFPAGETPPSGPSSTGGPRAAPLYEPLVQPAPSRTAQGRWSRAQLGSL